MSEFINVETALGEYIYAHYTQIAVIKQAGDIYASLYISGTKTKYLLSRENAQKIMDALSNYRIEIDNITDRKCGVCGHKT